MRSAVEVYERREDPVGVVEETDCCVVGGGPAGVMLALMLARQGVRVTLLEAHRDFDREFRGNTINPSALEILASLGLAWGVLRLGHAKVRRFTLQAGGRREAFADFSRLRTPYPYVLMLPQAHLLEFVVAEARRYPNFRLVMGARVRDLVEEAGEVKGVLYESEDGTHEVRAVLTVGADGRGSRVRRLAGFEPVKTSPPMDVLWFKLERREDDPEDAMGRFGSGRIAILLNRFDYWQAGYVIPKGTFPELRREGIGALRQEFAELVPEFADRLDDLEDFRQVSLLSVESSRCPRWYRPGLLLIGDAAHVMSPVGGVGINYAIQDAVVAANVLAGSLATSQRRLTPLDVQYLAAVQRRREIPTRLIQGLQALIQRRVLAPALRSDRQRRSLLPLRLLLRAPVLRSLPAHILGFGFWPVRVKS